MQKRSCMVQVYLFGYVCLPCSRVLEHHVKNKKYEAKPNG